MEKQRAVRLGKFAGIGLVALLVLIGALFALGVLGVPDGGLEDNEWGEVEEDRIEVITTVWVDNPNPFGLGGDVDVEYDVALEGVHLADGEGSDIDIGSGSNTLTFETDLRQQQLPAWWSAHINNDEVSEVSVDTTVHASLGPLSGSPSTTFTDEVETDIEGALEDGFSEFEGSHGPVEDDPRVAGVAVTPQVEIEEVTVEWGEVTEERTEFDMTVEIYNPNAYPIPTPGFAGSLEMNDLEMAEWTPEDVEVTQADQVIPPQMSEERTYTVEMDNSHIPPWLTSHIDEEQPHDRPGEEYSDMVISGQLVMEVSGIEVSIPEEGDGDGIACANDLYTDIFVDQESGVDHRSCSFDPIDVTTDQLEAVGATLDLTETDWWQANEDDLLDNGVDDILNGEEDETDDTDDDDETDDTTDDDDTDDDDDEDDDDGVLP